MVVLILLLLYYPAWSCTLNHPKVYSEVSSSNFFTWPPYHWFWRHAEPHKQRVAEAKLSCRACVVFSTVADILVLLEKLSQYLGVVELHLVRGHLYAAIWGPEATNKIWMWRSWKGVVRYRTWRRWYDYWECLLGLLPVEFWVDHKYLDPMAVRIDGF